MFLLCHTALFHDSIKSCGEKKEIRGHLETAALVPDISPPTVELCHSEPALVLKSLFNLYYWAAEEHHAARPAYISEALLSHTLPAPADICFVSTWVPRQPHYFLHTHSNTHICGKRMRYCTWLWHTTHRWVTCCSFIYDHIMDERDGNKRITEK